MIPEIKKILYATDLSRNSAYAFYYAVDLAKRRGATIVIVNAIQPAPAFILNEMSANENIQHDHEKETVEAIHKRLNNFCKKMNGHMGFPCDALVSKIIVRIGYPVAEILSIADDEECDVIILGSHGKGFLRQTFLGSVSRGVLDRTLKPVLIIPLPPARETIEWASM